MGTTVKQITQNMAQKEVLMNELNQAFSPVARFGRRNVDNPGLYYYYYGGRIANASGTAVDVSDGSILCVASKTNYIEYKIGTGVVVNQTGYTVGNIPIGRATTNTTTITNFLNDTIVAMLPTGVSPALSSGGSATAFGDITVVNSLVGASPGNTLFTVKGGKNWETGKVVRESSAVNVADYSSSSNFSYLSANKVYYVVLDLSTNSIKTSDASSALTFTSNGKLLWVIETDSTKISKVTDYRAMGLFIKNKTLLNTTQFYPGTATSYDFNMSNYYYQNQVADTDSVTATGGQYPRYVRPQTSLLCYVADNGYSPGEETEYLTSDASGLIWGKPCSIKNNGNIEVPFGKNVKIWNKSSGAWVTPSLNCWAVVCKLEMEYHS